MHLEAPTDGRFHPSHDTDRSRTTRRRHVRPGWAAQRPRFDPALSRDASARAVDFVDILPSVVTLRGNSLLVRKGVSPRLRAWRVARALAYWTLRRRGVRSANVLTIDALAACLRTPRRAFTRVARDTGADFVELGDVFATSESAAALRYGETMGQRLTLIAPPLAPRLRGSGPIKGIARTVALRDARPRRVRLYA